MKKLVIAVFIFALCLLPQTANAACVMCST